MVQQQVDSSQKESLVNDAQKKKGFSLLRTTKNAASGTRRLIPFSNRRLKQADLQTRKVPPVHQISFNASSNKADQDGQEKSEKSGGESGVSTLTDRDGLNRAAAAAEHNTQSSISSKSSAFSYSRIGREKKKVITPDMKLFSAQKLMPQMESASKSPGARGGGVDPEERVGAEPVGMTKAERDREASLLVQDAMKYDPSPQPMSPTKSDKSGMRDSPPEKNKSQSTSEKEKKMAFERVRALLSRVNPRVAAANRGGDDEISSRDPVDPSPLNKLKNMGMKSEQGKAQSYRDPSPVSQTVIVQATDLWMPTKSPQGNPSESSKRDVLDPPTSPVIERKPVDAPGEENPMFPDILAVGGSMRNEDEKSAILGENESVMNSAKDKPESLFPDILGDSDLDAPISPRSPRSPNENHNPSPKKTSNRRSVDNGQKSMRDRVLKSSVAQKSRRKGKQNIDVSDDESPAPVIDTEAMLAALESTLPLRSGTSPRRKSKSKKKKSTRIVKEVSQTQKAFNKKANAIAEKHEEKKRLSLGTAKPSAQNAVITGDSLFPEIIDLSKEDQTSALEQKSRNDQLKAKWRARQNSTAQGRDDVESSDEEDTDRYAPLFTVLTPISPVQNEIDGKCEEENKNVVHGDAVIKRTVIEEAAILADEMSEWTGDSSNGFEGVEMVINPKYHVEQANEERSTQCNVDTVLEFLALDEEKPRDVHSTSNLKKRDRSVEIYDTAKIPVVKALENNVSGENRTALVLGAVVEDAASSRLIKSEGKDISVEIYETRQSREKILSPTKRGNDSLRKGKIVSTFVAHSPTSYGVEATDDKYHLDLKGVWTSNQDESTEEQSSEEGSSKNKGNIVKDPSGLQPDSSNVTSDSSESSTSQAIPHVANHDPGFVSMEDSSESLSSNQESRDMSAVPQKSPDSVDIDGTVDPSETSSNKLDENEEEEEAQESGVIDLTTYASMDDVDEKVWQFDQQESSVDPKESDVESILDLTGLTNDLVKDKPRTTLESVIQYANEFLHEQNVENDSSSGFDYESNSSNDDTPKLLLVVEGRDIADMREEKKLYPIDEDMEDVQESRLPAKKPFRPTVAPERLQKARSKMTSQTQEYDDPLNAVVSIEDDQSKTSTLTEEFTQKLKQQPRVRPSPESFPISGARIPKICATPDTISLATNNPRDALSQGESELHSQIFLSNVESMRSSEKSVDQHNPDEHKSNHSSKNGSNKGTTSGTETNEEQTKSLLVSESNSDSAESFGVADSSVLADPMAIPVSSPETSDKKTDEHSAKTEAGAKEASEQKESALESTKQVSHEHDLLDYFFETTEACFCGESSTSALTTPRLPAANDGQLSTTNDTSKAVAPGHGSTPYRKDILDTVFEGAEALLCLEDGETHCFRSTKEKVRASEDKMAPLVDSLADLPKSQSPLAEEPSNEQPDSDRKITEDIQDTTSVEKDELASQKAGSDNNSAIAKTEEKVVVEDASQENSTSVSDTQNRSTEENKPMFSPVESLVFDLTKSEEGLENKQSTDSPSSYIESIAGEKLVMTPTEEKMSTDEQKAEIALQSQTDDLEERNNTSVQALGPSSVDGSSAHLSYLVSSIRAAASADKVLSIRESVEDSNTKQTVSLEKLTVMTGFESTKLASKNTEIDDPILFKRKGVDPPSPMRSCQSPHKRGLDPPSFDKEDVIIEDPPSGNGGIGRAWSDESSRDTEKVLVPGMEASVVVGVDVDDDDTTDQHTLTSVAVVAPLVRTVDTVLESEKTENPDDANQESQQGDKTDRSVSTDRAVTVPAGTEATEEGVEVAIDETLLTSGENDESTKALVPEKGSTGGMNIPQLVAQFTDFTDASWCSSPFHSANKAEEHTNPSSRPHSRNRSPSNKRQTRINAENSDSSASGDDSLPSGKRVRSSRVERTESLLESSSSDSSKQDESQAKILKSGVSKESLENSHKTLSDREQENKAAFASSSVASAPEASTNLLSRVEKIRAMVESPGKKKKKSLRFDDFNPSIASDPESTADSPTGERRKSLAVGRSPRLQSVLDRLRKRSLSKKNGLRSVDSCETAPMNAQDLFTRYDSIVRNMNVNDQQKIRRIQQRELYATRTVLSRNLEKSPLIDVTHLNPDARELRSVGSKQFPIKIRDDSSVSDLRASPNGRPTPSHNELARRQIEKSNSFSSASGEFSTTPSQKARNLRKQLDDALETSVAIRNTQEKLNSEISNFKSRLQWQSQLSPQSLSPSSKQPSPKLSQRRWSSAPRSRTGTGQLAGAPSSHGESHGSIAELIVSHSTSKDDSILYLSPSPTSEADEDEIRSQQVDSILNGLAQAVSPKTSGSQA